jgi:cytochrome c oxidase assembly protein subunit 11
MSRADQDPDLRRHRRMQAIVGGVCAAVAVGMVGAAYAAVPLYRMFCQVTGFGGTVKRGDGPQAAALERTITVRFDTNVNGDLPWTFKAEQVTQDVRIGAPGLAYFRVKNNSDQPIMGRATYNVSPDVAGAYFVKTQCFCFDDQVIPAQTEMRFPVIYYVQPEFAEDRNTRLFQEVVLSYTFFRTPDQGGAKTAGVPKADKAG